MDPSTSATCGSVIDRQPLFGVLEHMSDTAGGNKFFLLGLVVLGKEAELWQSGKNL